MARRKPANTKRFEPEFPTGWVENPAEVDAITVAMGGDRALFSASPFHGYSQELARRGVTGVFPHRAEKKLFGRWLGAFYQRRGTCVGQASTRGFMDSMYQGIVDRGLVARLAQVAVAPLYGYARTAIGRGQLRGSDGCVVAWAIQAAMKMRLVPRRRIGQYDLSKFNGDENYAVSWGDNGVPQEVIDAGECELVGYRCKTADDIADAAAAGFALVFGGRYTYSQKDKNGIARLNRPSNHSTEAVGWAISSGGNVLIGGQQSWGDGTPAGPNKLVYKGGEEELRPGMSFVPVEDYYNVARTSGEIWAVQVLDAFRPKSTSEAV